MARTYDYSQYPNRSQLNALRRMLNEDAGINALALTPEATLIAWREMGSDKSIPNEVTIERMIDKMDWSDAISVGRLGAAKLKFAMANETGLMANGAQL